jgi:hypothetical protein
MIGGLLSGIDEFLVPKSVPEGAPYDAQTLQMARATLLANLGATLLSAGQGGQSYDQRAQTLGGIGKGVEAYNQVLRGDPDQKLKQLQLQSGKQGLEKGALEMEAMRRAAAQQQAWQQYLQQGLTPSPLTQVATQAAGVPVPSSAPPGSPPVPAAGGPASPPPSMPAATPATATPPASPVAGGNPAAGAGTWWGPLGISEQMARAISKLPAQRQEEIIKDLTLARAKPQPYSITKDDDGSLIAVNPMNPTDMQVVRPGFGERPLTEDEYKAYRIPPGTPAVMTRQGPKYLQQSGTTVNVGGDTTPDAALRKQLSEDEGKRMSKAIGAADVAGGLRQDFEILDELIKIAPQGPITGRLAQAFPGVSNAGTVFQSIVKRVAPTLRVEGSGSTSDIEYEGMLQSLPQLIARPEANAAIAEAMKQKAQINIERGAIIMAYQNQEIDANEMRRQLMALNRRSILTPSLRQMIGGMGSGGSAAAPQGERPPLSDIFGGGR